MQQVQLSYRSVEASYTNVQFASQQQSLALQIGADKAQEGLTKQQNQIIDEVGVSSEAVDKLREAQVLAEQLKKYLDYLKGKDLLQNYRVLPYDNNADVTISGRSTTLAGSVTVASYSEETLDIAATFDDDGNLTELVVDKTSVSAEYVKADIILEDTQFFAQLNA